MTLKHLIAFAVMLFSTHVSAGVQDSAPNEYIQELERYQGEFHFIECDTYRHVEAFKEAKTGLCAIGHTIHAMGKLLLHKEYLMPVVYTITRTPDGEVTVSPAPPE